MIIVKTVTLLMFCFSYTLDIIQPTCDNKRRNQKGILGLKNSYIK